MKKIGKKERSEKYKEREKNSANEEVRDREKEWM